MRRKLTKEEIEDLPVWMRGKTLYGEGRRLSTFKVQDKIVNLYSGKIYELRGYDETGKNKHAILFDVEKLDIVREQVEPHEREIFASYNVLPSENINRSIQTGLFAS